MIAGEDISKNVTVSQKDSILPCPFCGNVPVELFKNHIVSHEEGCFLRRHGLHTRLTGVDLLIWNRRDIKL